MLMDIAIWLSEKPCPSSESVEAVKNSIFAHLEATRGEPNTETTRLLAAKFVADEAVKLIGELKTALANIVATEHCINDEGVKAQFIRNVYPALAKAAQFTAAGTTPAVGGASEPVIFPPGEVEAVPEHEPNYEPNWPGVIDWFNALAVNKDGEVWAHVSSPEIDGDVWESDEKYLFDTIAPTPGDTWKQMIYKRPE